ncbi:TIGR02281 family clan AA aspartic protease [Nitratireductor kimnyeongensis]|uniref:TIGR02281 family clan AA aspartic protease n=1 Tax=Nitratireductor kimnyeongensis TaxID=430679 RepID=A0ABW0TAR5_9HYPH|nr:TIGR02281 family clan AA aspartic protease [Nitratireductor kimnyeongensis]QZZ35723.1 TIGR02281 family clan AA aspartic protease [Nitratireductor kimnyeongensis]
MRLFWLLMSALGGGLILLIANHDSGRVFGLENSAFAATLYLGLWAAVLIVGFLGSGLRIGDVARTLAFWVFLLLALVAAYQYRYELQDFASRVTAGLMPGSPMTTVSKNGQIHVIVERSSSGQFEVIADVNGTRLRMLIDTGASSMVLSDEDARAAGFEPERLRFVVPVATANGTTVVARARADTVNVGAISRNDIPIYMAQAGRLDQSLLGMSFINTLNGFDLRGDRIVLRD